MALRAKGCGVGRRARGTMGAAVLPLALLLAAACGDGGPGPADPGGAADALDGADRPADPGAPEDGRDEAGGPDAPGPDPAGDPAPGDADDAPDGAGPDVPAPPEPAFVPPDGALRASYATRDLPVPLGLSTGGYGQTPPPSAPRSPFAEVFQATTTQWHPPRVQVVHLLKGDRRLLLVQCDLIAIFRSLHVFVADRVRARTGVDVADALLLAGNHSHTGPGRVYDTPLGPLFLDTYEEQVFQRVAGAVVDAVVDALGQEAPRVRFGLATTADAEMHQDRRCENGPLQDDTMHLLRWDRLDGGGTVALAVNYALHGTVFGWQDGVVGGDAPRAVEMKVREVLPGAPPVVFFQSWTGDVGPGDPLAEDPAGDAPGAPLPTLDRLEAIGRQGAGTVLAAWDSFHWEEDPDLVVVSAVAPMTWEAIGYAPGEWDHPAGALLCGGGAPACGAPPDMSGCLDLDWGWIPDTVRLTAFRLGVAAGVTLPGEPHTSLAQDLLARVAMRVRPAWENLLFGYAQDYVGYLMEPADFAGGGYEPGMAFFGPREGQYLAGLAEAVAARLSNPAAPLPFEPVPLPAWAPGASRPYAPAASLARGTVVQDLPAAAASGDLLTFRWTGGDPWVDRPEVVLQRRGGDGAFAPVTAGGVPVDHRGYRMLLSVQPDPPWGQAAPAGRTFTWTATLRTALRVPAPEQRLSGVLRLAVSGRAAGPDGTEEPYALVSGPAEVAAPAAPVTP